MIKIWSGKFVKKVSNEFLSLQLHADGYHTSPTHQRTPLVPRDLGEDFNLDFDDESARPLDPRKAKNAKWVHSRHKGIHLRGNFGNHSLTLIRIHTHCTELTEMPNIKSIINHHLKLPINSRSVFPHLDSHFPSLSCHKISLRFV